MTIKVTNQTNKRLKIVLPPSLIASGATGQFGGGGMGGGGGGMGGGMGGGGFRSVPPTQLANAMLAPGQTRGLATGIVSLGAPGADGEIAYPAKGEQLQLGDASELQGDPRIQAALVRLAKDKAPGNVAQMVLWGVAGMSWDEVARLSSGWANAQELALAKQMVGSLDAKTADDTGRFLIEVTAKDDAQKGIATELKSLFADRVMLGLTVESTVPVKPTGPAVACKVQIQGTAAKPEALVQVATTDATGLGWTPTGKFTLPVALDEAGKIKAAAFGDALAEELLKRLVKVVVSKPSANNGGLFAKTAKEHDKTAYTVRIDNYSPLMLNGIALIGAGAKESEPLKILAGISLSPRRSLALPVSADSADSFGLKTGVKVLALDLSGL